jgi:quercetin dioxygenase-like cupin family protein
MKRIAPTLTALALALAAPLCWSADAAAPVVKDAADIDFHASGSLPPGTEYHVIYEDPKTHAVELLVRMPKGYSLPAHSHSFDESIYVVKGKVILGFGSEKKTISACGYAVIPAGIAFTMDAAGFGGVQMVAAFNGPFDVKLAAPAKP